jgi:hypothetical protein
MLAHSKAVYVIGTAALPVITTPLLNKVTFWPSCAVDFPDRIAECYRANAAIIK